jgi:pimeloyl-ACP methyl ester carboxylesterase
MHILAVSDIYNRPANLDWLSSHGTIDLLTLGSLCNRPSLTGTELHSHLFEHGGIQEVVSGLLKFKGESLVGLGFSAGGTALWWAAKEGLPLTKLICVSSTRLRNEHASLAIPTYTFWGELDPHRPDEAWCRSVPGHSHMYETLGHAFYDETSSSHGERFRADLVSALGA